MIGPPPRPVVKRAALIESEEVLAAALSIHTVEARHAAVLNMLVGDPITPDGAFAVTIGQTRTAAPSGELAVDFEPMNRGAFLLKGALAAGALYGAASVGPLVQRVFAQGGGGDVDILNFAYTLELLEADFYAQALKSVKLSSDVKKFAEEVGSNEQDHVDALNGAITKLGGKPAKTPAFTFPLKDEKSFMELSVTFEDTGVSAYNGAGPAIQSKDLLATAGSIVQIEGRHAGAIRYLSGLQPVVGAFDTTLDMDKVLAAVKPFIKA